MLKDKHGTQVSDGDILRFNDGTIEQVISYDGILHIEIWPLTAFDSRDYEIIKKGDENEDELS